jgi:integrase
VIRAPRRSVPAPSLLDAIAAVQRAVGAVDLAPTLAGDVDEEVRQLRDVRGYARNRATAPGALSMHRGREPRNKGKVYEPNPPTVAEIMAMLRICPTDIYGRRIFACILVAWQGALRVFEMLALDADDLDRASGWIQIRHGKGDKAATIKMAAWAWPMLDPWLELRATLPDPRGAVFCVIDGPTAGAAWKQPDSRKKLKEIAVAAGVTKRMSWHQLRHAWAAWSFVDGVDLRTLQIHLRHSNIGITDTYLRGLGVGKSHETVYQAPIPSVPATALLELARG